MSTPTQKIPDAFRFLLEKKSRWKVAYGGRGGAKSWNFARALIIKATQEPLRILCAREIQKSIRDSVHTLLSDQINNMGLTPNFEIKQNEIIGVNGSKFIFSGLSDLTALSIKSMEGIDIAWLEEAQSISKRSYQLLIPTIRKDQSEIWVSFNPDLETDETYRRFIEDPPDNAIIKKVGYKDNPWFPQVLKEEMAYLAKVDPDAYSHVWLGNCVLHSDDQVLSKKVSIQEFEPELDWNGPYFGADWGFAQDPTTLVKSWIKGRSLYVEYEAWGLGVDIDATPSLFDIVPQSRQFQVIADSARPETISYMNKRGFRIHPAVKGPGSIEDGISHLRGFEEIIIHPRCTHTIEETRLYRYKRDRLTDQITTKIIDANNHCIDALRYALEPVMRHGVFKKNKKTHVEPIRDWMAL